MRDVVRTEVQNLKACQEILSNQKNKYYFDQYFLKKSKLMQKLCEEQNIQILSNRISIFPDFCFASSSNMILTFIKIFFILSFLVPP